MDHLAAVDVTAVLIYGFALDTEETGWVKSPPKARILNLHLEDSKGSFPELA